MPKYVDRDGSDLNGYSAQNTNDDWTEQTLSQTQELEVETFAAETAQGADGAELIPYEWVA